MWKLSLAVLWLGASSADVWDINPEETKMERLCGSSERRGGEIKNLTKTKTTKNEKLSKATKVQ